MNFSSFRYENSKFVVPSYNDTHLRMRHTPSRHNKSFLPGQSGASSKETSKLDFLLNAVIQNKKQSLETWLTSSENPELNHYLPYLPNPKKRNFASVSNLVGLKSQTDNNQSLQDQNFKSHQRNSACRSNLEKLKKITRSSATDIIDSSHERNLDISDHWKAREGIRGRVYMKMEYKPIFWKYNLECYRRPDVDMPSRWREKNLSMPLFTRVVMADTKFKKRLREKSPFKNSIRKHLDASMVDGYCFKNLENPILESKLSDLPNPKLLTPKRCHGTLATGRSDHSQSEIGDYMESKKKMGSTKTLESNNAQK
jgi:hypothetical protein